MIVAGTSAVYRFSPTGTLLNTYTFPGTSLLFALNLDPDLSSFWTGDVFTGKVFKVDINSGTVLTSFDTSPATKLGGLAVFGEVTAAQPKLTLTPVSSTHQVL